MYFSLSDIVKRIEQFWKCAIKMLYIIIIIIYSLYLYADGLDLFISNDHNAN